MRKLFLASSMKHPDSLSKLRNFVGESFEDKKIVYIPTAANGESYGSWRKGESIKIVSSLKANLKIIELENFTVQDIFTPIESADILWVGGGYAGYLLYWMRRSTLDQKLPSLLSQGTIYIGSSSGSMVCAKTQLSTEWNLGEPELGASLVPGLGLVDFEIYPHYRDELLPEIKKLWRGNELYLLKDGEVIRLK